MNELELLKPVSRSFYISIRLLPKALREPVALGYLLARTSDTIADGTAVDVEKRIELLDRFARAIAGKDQAMGNDLTQLCGSPGMTDGENALLGSADEILQSLQNLSPEDQRDLRELLAVITRGQRQDLTRWHGGLAALANAEELREYTYLVAGCVGEFWTRVCFRKVQSFTAREWNRICRVGSKLWSRIAAGKYFA